MKIVFMNTLLEVRRKKMFLIIMIISLSLLALWTVGLGVARAAFDDTVIDTFSINFSEVAFLLITLGTSIFFLLCIINAVMMGANSLSSDVENGLLNGVLSRPISRTSYQLGRMMAFLTMSVFFATMLFGGQMLVAALLGALGRNSFSGITFSIFLQSWLLLIALQFAIICVAQFFGTFLKTGAVIALTISLYFVGSFGPALMSVGDMLSTVDDFTGVAEAPEAGAIMESVGQGISFVAPLGITESLFTQTLMQNTNDFGFMGMLNANIPWWWLLYTLIYSTILFGFAVFIFKRRDL